MKKTEEKMQTNFVSLHKEKKSKENKKDKFKKSEETESKLEKEIEKPKENIEENKFVEFLKIPQGKTDSTLEKIQNSPLQINLEQTASSVTLSEIAKTEDDSFKYSAGTASKDEPKYISTESIQTFRFIKPPSPLDAFNPGKTFVQERQNVAFANSWESFDSGNWEKYSATERFDPLENKKKDLFEKKEIKYTPSG